MKVLDKLENIEFGSAANLAKLRATYIYVGLGILLATIGLIMALPFAKELGMMGWIILSVLEFGALFLFMYKKNIVTYSLFTFLTGVTLFPIISSLISMNLSYIILQALIGTLIIVGLLTFYTLTTTKNFMNMKTILLYILIGIIVIAVINIFLGNSILSLIISIVVMVVFSFFIIIDTQEVLYTDVEPLDAACSLYLSILNMFVALLNILSFFEKD